MYFLRLEVQTKTNEVSGRTRVEVLINTAGINFWVEAIVVGYYERVLNSGVDTAGNALVLIGSKEAVETVAERNVVATQERCVLHEVVAGNRVAQAGEAQIDVLIGKVRVGTVAVNAGCSYIAPVAQEIVVNVVVQAGAE